MSLLEGVLFQRPCAGLGPPVCEFGGPGLGDLLTLAEDHASSEVQPASPRAGLRAALEAASNRHPFWPCLPLSAPTPLALPVPLPPHTWHYPGDWTLLVEPPTSPCADGRQLQGRVPLTVPPLPLPQACGCPLYWKGPLFCGAGGERTGSVSVHKFVAMWRKVLQNCHDDAAKFVHLLMNPGCNYLVQEDFIPFLQDVVNTHPGLAFLKEASEFHSRYITTVIQRIFYTVNRSWSGRITCAELRRSSFLQNVALLEEEADINQLTEFFSYEHFYVIYCKFWELDTDHDLLIDAQDLARHNDHAISSRMIDRIFSGAVTRGKKVQKGGKISYADFVWFLISEEDKKTPTSIEYWFRCMDLDGDGALSMFELEYFYEEQCRRLDSMAIEALPFEDCLCQMLDLVKPQSEGKITLSDLKRCKLAGVFFDTFFNIEKYLDHEQREQASLLRESDSEGPELSDWERYAAEEYDLLVAEEAVGEPWEDGYEAELSPVDQKLSALRSPLAQRPFFETPSGLGTVDLYECGDDDLQPS
ncbi:serine/threonine-protein phosphatase 2A regulatory subunit B'' subunit beta-like [Phacochoerus africanus]|uniref:serine/threonine-protein phosphatase 2A regulatory subunit B'' subunit beta-like n=1 Tax=Phacochoerus africanus TaxID=41426 RepID=UPI001FD9487C|nr:serine/threonine-protein phosphatase 2A regulatory subunit B'' subunit beta-like [Phacochoerus africanus]